jgi:magnesium transporter
VTTESANRPICGKGSSRCCRCSSAAIWCACVLYWNWQLGVVMATATLLNLLLAAAVGIAVPVGMQRLGRDPAFGSSVLLIFMTDSMGFFIFLGRATLFLLS